MGEHHNFSHSPVIGVRGHEKLFKCLIYHGDTFSLAGWHMNCEIGSCW